MLRTSKTFVRIKFTIGFLITAVTVGCSDMEVGSTWARQAAARPTLGRKFAWASEADRTIDDLQGVQPALRDAARQIIEQEYTAKGYQKAPSAQEADFWLRSKVATAKRGDAYSAGTFEEYTEGTLVIYMIDPASGDWIWRGWGTARLHDNNPPEQKRERLQRALQTMLKDLPKGPASK